MGYRLDEMRGAAYRKKGEEWRNAIIAFDFLVTALPWLLVAAVLGAGGWFGHRLWAAAGDAVGTGLPGVVSAIGTHWWAWVLLAGAVVGAVTTFTSPFYSRARNVWTVALLTVGALVVLWVVSLFI